MLEHAVIKKKLSKKTPFFAPLKAFKRENHVIVIY